MAGFLTDRSSDDHGGSSCRYFMLLLPSRFSRPGGGGSASDAAGNVFALTSGRLEETLPKYSDEIAQDSHLFPFYLKLEFQHHMPLTKRIITLPLIKYKFLSVDMGRNRYCE